MSACAPPAAVALADGLDDACTAVAIEAVNIDSGAPLTILALQGPTVVLGFDTFPADVSGDLTFLEAQIVTDAGSTLPSLQGQRGPTLELLLEDVNRDGIVDRLDYDIVGGDIPMDGPPLDASDPAFESGLDLNGDQVLDPDYLSFFELLAPDVIEGATADELLPPVAPEEG